MIHQIHTYEKTPKIEILTIFERNSKCLKDYEENSHESLILINTNFYKIFKRVETRDNLL